MYKFCTSAVYCCILLSTMSVRLSAQDTESTPELDSLINLHAFTEESELQKILNKGVTVSSQKALSTRETPGIISVITAEEIQNMGARDLTDVLRLVPGFEIMQDLQFVMGIGLRGSWANEGKVLVMLDGQPFNELLYQTVALGNRFSVDAIERVEIIRGPGSAIYGGSAEYGVINIITKAAQTLDGAAVYGTGGIHNSALGRVNYGFMAAQHGKDVSWDISGFKGKGIISDRSFTELGGDEEFNLSKVTDANPFNLNAGLKIKNFALRTMYDEFKTSDPFTFISYKGFYVDARYVARVGDKLTLTPIIKYYNQVPWTFGTKGEVGNDFRARATRTLSQVDFVYEPNRKFNLNVGGIYFVDKAEFIDVSDLFTGERNLTLNNFAIYAQAVFQHRLFNATAGFRFEKNNRYDGAFVPRLALTKKIENFHFKVLYSESFRSPSIQNINIHLTNDAKPERSSVFEFELGYQFTKEMLLAVNAFSITSKDVLIYGSEGDGDDFVEWYENFEKSGSNGVEMVYSFRKKNWYASLTYSFSKAISGNTVDTYHVPGVSNRYVGFPLHKMTLNTNFYLTPSISLNPTFVYSTSRYVYTSVDDADEPVIEKIDPYLLSNVFLNFKDILPGLTAGAGVYDLLNVHPLIAQAYNGYSAPIPGRSREYIIKLSYQINFTKEKQ